jgi:acetyl esterase/lipase
MKHLLMIAAVVVCVPASGQNLVMPLWPTPLPSNGGVEHVTVQPAQSSPGGKSVTLVTNVTRPSVAVYLPRNASKAVPAVLVFPGGGYKVLAYDLEGTEVCDWLNSIDVACLLVKYRVPFVQHYPERDEDLQDALQAMRVSLSHAAQWHIDPRKIGVLGFSAGAHLAVVLSTHSRTQSLSAADPALRPAFEVILYPGYLAKPNTMELAEGLQPVANAPPTFLLQSEDDPVGVENVLAYFVALKAAHVPTELHIYAHGGHGYGLRATGQPIAQWPTLVERWFRTLGVLSSQRAPDPTSQ